MDWTHQTVGVQIGFDPDTDRYKVARWQYKDKACSSVEADAPLGEQTKDDPDPEFMSKGPPERDPTLQHPNCVYQILKRHYARYTPEMVEQATGCPKETGFPVPQVLGLSGKESVIGSSFFVMDLVEGRIFWDASFAEVERAARPLYFDAISATIAACMASILLRSGLAIRGTASSAHARERASGFPRLVQLRIDSMAPCA